MGEVLESEKAFLVRKTTRFGVALYQKLASRAGNLLFSPLGVSVALAMVDAGMRGGSAKELETRLGWKLPPERARAVLASLLAGSEHGGFEQTSRVFGPGRFLDGFKRQILALDGEPESVPRGPEGTRAALLAWLGQQGRHPRLGPELSPRGGWAFAQVIGLPRAWRWPFSTGRTETARFGAHAQVGMMHQVMTVPVARKGRINVVELPYEDPRLALDLLVPDQGEELHGLERALSSEYLDALWAELQPRTVELSLPKFELDAVSNLVPELVARGLRAPFATTDWSGMMTEQGAHLELVLQLARLSVDERGSEPCAAKQPRASTDEPSLSLALDRPFLIIVRDVLDGTILLMGRLIDPTRSEN